jgi:tRNA(fMet)-specific endonuclease VapC
MAYLLDTNILIYFFKNLGAVRLHMARQQDTDIHLCTPVLWELRTGAHKSEYPATQFKKLAAVQARFRVHAFDEASAEKAALVRAQLERQGTPIGTTDTLIAGIALAHELTLVTRNTREFGRVSGLPIENWFDNGSELIPTPASH